MLKAKNEIEKLVLQYAEEGYPIFGEMREIWIMMQMREDEEEAKR